LFPDTTVPRGPAATPKRVSECVGPGVSAGNRAAILAEIGRVAGAANVNTLDVWNELRDARWDTDRSVTANGIRYRYIARINRIEWDRPDDVGMAVSLGTGKVYVDGVAVARDVNTRNLEDPRLRQPVEAALAAVHEAIHREKWEEEAQVEREWKAALDRRDEP